MQEKEKTKNVTAFRSRANNFFVPKTTIVIIRKIRQVRAMQESLFVDQSNLVRSKRRREKRDNKKKLVKRK
jgi:hypothetical protein